MDALILSASEGRVVPLGPILMIVKEDGTCTRGTLAIAEFEVAPRVPTPPLHVHHAHEEGFYILDGELEFLVGMQQIHTDKGTYVTVPLGVPHTFMNTGNVPARFLTTFTPPQYLNYFFELSELMARYETEVVGI